MSSYRAGHSKSEIRKPAREGLSLSTKLGLLAAGSLLPIIAAPAANAQCVAVDGANQPVPLNAITSSSTVSCSGTSTNQILVDAPGADNIVVNINGNASGLITSFDGANSQINIFGNANLSNSALGSTGDAGAVIFSSGTGSNVSLTALGQNSLIALLGGSLTTQQILLTGDGTRFESSSGSTVSAFGATTGNGVIAGGLENNQYAFGGALTARNDGLLLTDTGGNDIYYLNAGATFGAAGGATGRIVDLDGQDLMIVLGTHSLFLDVAGIENLVYSGSASDSFDFRGTGTFNQLNVQSGQIGQFELGSLMTSDAVINIASGASLRYGVGAFSPAFSQTLQGTGDFQLDSAPTQITADNSGFSGTFLLTGTAMVENDNAFGVGNVINQNGTILLSSSAIGNQISGSGQIYARGGGSTSRATLSGVNTYSGGTFVANFGSMLLLTNASAAGTGSVDIGSDAFLELDFGAAGGQFTNLVTGDGSVRKVGSGLLTLANAANDYTGGTQINAGVLRVTDLDALGTGGVVANAGGALMYDYSGPGNQNFTTPLITGAGQFIKNGSGTIVMSSPNTWTGGSQILAGRIGLNDGQGLGSGNIAVAQGAILGIGGVTLANNVTGAGQIIKTANNTAELTGVNTLTGGIVIEDGAIQVAAGTALGSGSVDILAGGALLVVNNADTTVGAQLQGAGAFVKNGSGRTELTGVNGLAGVVAVNGGALAVSGTSNLGGTTGVQVAAGATLELARSQGNSSFNNEVTGDGRLLKTGTSTIEVGGNNSYTGGTAIQGGALRVTDVSRLGTGAIAVDAGAALDLLVTGDTSFSHAISGAGVLRKSGAGSLSLLSNALSGGLDITGGNVTVNAIAALGSGPVSTAQAATLTIDNAANAVSSASITGAGRLIKNGAGDLIIQNANTYTGGTVINSSRVGLNNGQGLGTGAVLVNANGVLGLGGVTVANTISGAGSVLKTSNNVGVLTGVNAFSGGTTIQDGTLRVSGGQALGTGAVSVAAGAILDVTSNANSAMANLVQGAGALNKGGSGVLTISSQNTFSGGATIAAGAVALTNGQGLGTGAAAIGSGASLSIGDIAVSNVISGAGSVVKTGSGLGQLTGANTYSGGTSVSAGTLRVAGLSSLGTGGVSVAAGATLEMSNVTDAVFANALSGAGTLRKSGAGALTFSSNFTVGSLAVDAGRVRLNAGLTGNASVGAGAILNGTGTISGTLTNNGLLAPGNSIGTLNVQGNYVHNAGSVLEIEFDDAGGIDLLNVGGTATLNGGTLRFVSLGGAEGSGGTFLNAAGGVTGTFATVETVGAQLPLSVIYQPTSGVMAPSILTARPSTFNSQALAASDTVIGFADMVSTQALRSGQGNGAWIEALGANASRGAVGQTLAYDSDSSGISAGMRGPLTDRIDAGVSLGWSQADVSLGSNAGGGQQDGMLASVFGRYRLDGASLGAGILYGSLEQSTVRNVSFNSFSASVAGDTDSVVTGAFLSADAAFGEAGGWTFGGAAQASYLSQTQDAYTESGSSPLRLQLPELTFETIGLQAGLQAGTAFDLGGSAASLRLDVGLRHSSALDDRVIPVRFAASSASVDLQGDARDHTSPIAGASFEWALGGSISLTAGYQGRFGDDERHEARLGVHVGF
jgi:autotransporter-associated beta strand protein